MAVSALRTLVLGASPASFYGGYGQIPPLRWPTAEPDGILDYSIDASAPLADVGATITSVGLTIAPFGAGELVASNLSVLANVITVWLAGGIPGRVYEIKVLALSGDGHEFEWLIRLAIDPTLASFPPSRPYATSFGPVLNAGSTIHLELEDDSGGILLEDGSGYLLEESIAAIISTTFHILLEDGSGALLIEDASGYLLEG